MNVSVLSFLGPFWRLKVKSEAESEAAEDEATQRPSPQTFLRVKSSVSLKEGENTERENFAWKTAPVDTIL